MHFILLAAAIAGPLFSISAWCSTLPAETSFTQCIFNHTTTVTGASNCSVGGADALATLAPFAAVSAAATGSGGFGSSGLAQLGYSFEVEGGNAGDVVPLIITAYLHTDGGSQSAGDAIINVFMFGGAVASMSACSPSTCQGTADFFGSFGVSATVGDVNSVSLTAEASLSTPTAPDADASADPLITVDPTFANASQYSIVLSPGVANSVVAAPEPGTAWPLAAVVLAGAFHRRRRAWRRRRSPRDLGGDAPAVLHRSRAKGG
jgi:hypothetical protein